eukprot:c28950_g1_i1 orf=575-5044(+)
MDDTPELSAESHDHNVNSSVQENHQNASHGMEGNTVSCAEVKEDAMEDPSHVQNIISTDTCSEAETLGAPSLSIAGDLSSKGDETGKDELLHDHISPDKKAIQEHVLEGNTIPCMGTGDYESSNITSADEEDSQEHSMEGGDDKSINIASADSCIEAETLVEQSVSIPEGCKIERNDGEKDEHQCSCFVYPSSIEENGEAPDYLPCSKANLEQERMIAIQVANDLDNNIDGSLSNDESVESHDPVFERLGGDEETKAGAEDLIGVFVAKAPDEVQSVGEYKISDVTDCRGIFSDVAGREEGKSRLGSKGSDTGDSGSSGVLMKPKAIQDEDTMDELSVFNETTCLVLQGLPSQPKDEAPQGGAVGSITHVQNDEGDCLKAADSIQGANDSFALCGTKNMVNSSISINLLNTEDRSMSTAQVGQSSRLMIKQDSCSSGNESTLSQRSLIGPEIASNEPEDTATHVKSEGDSTSRSLEVRTCVVENVAEDNASAGDVKSEDATSSRDVKGRTCVVDTVEFSELAHGESLMVEEHNASAGDEKCLLAAGLSSSKICSPRSSSIRSPISQVRAMDDDNLNVRCSKDNTNSGVSFETTSLCQTEDGAPSSEDQLHGFTVDKDGGSSMDSTAGTGWKLQGIDGCIAAEDEEASSTGGEDSASSPACIQPSAQQRKKINIHHQFVREIVKIQHDREQYDREHAERQVQAQQAANLAQLGGKSSDVKEHKTNLCEIRQLRSETNKHSSQKGLKDHGADRQIKESQQKHVTRNKKSSLIQAKDGSSYQKIAPHESSEQGRETILQRRDSLGAKEYGRTARGKQQRSMSIYRPPVVRETLAAGSHEQKNLGELETSYHQSGSFTLNSSPDSSTSSVSEPRVPIIGLPDLVNNEGTHKVVRSSSGEFNAHNLETQAEQCAPGMGIKVTFDTERKLRHIEFSDGPDLPRGQRQNEQMSHAASHSSSGFGNSKSPMVNPLLSHGFQDSKSSSITSSNISKRQVGMGETPSKGNDRYFTQADKSSWSQGGSFTESSQSRGKVEKPSDYNVERKNTFFEQADNSAILYNSRSWKSPSSVVCHVINDGRSGQNIYSDSLRHSDGHTRDMRTPNALLQGLNTPSSRKSASLGSSYKGEQWAATSFATPHVRGDEPNRIPINRQANFQSQQFNVSRLQHDTKGKQRLNNSTDGSKKKRDSQFKNSTKESGSPFQAMMKDVNRPQVMFSSPAPQTSAEGSLDFQGFGMSWHGEDRTCTRRQDNSQESLKRSLSDASRRSSTQNIHGQLSPMTPKEGVFCTMPMQEKWGDIVDDLSDTYDYLQVKGEGQREPRSGSLSYGAHNQSGAVFIDAASLKAEKPIFRDSKQDKAFRKYGYKETDSFQKNKAASDLVQDHSAYESPARKSVFERLGPQKNFKDSILGPPPKVADSRGVLKASPDAFVSNVPPGSTYKSFDSGFHGSQQASHLSSMLHDSGDNIIDEGREVVVQAYTEMKQRRSKRELYVPRRGS